MKRSTKKVLAMLLTFALIITSVFSYGISADAATKAKKVKLNAKKATLTVGQVYQLKVKSVTPKKAKKAVKYKTSKKAVATVNAKGLVTAKKKGKATITAISKSNKKAKATFKVTVKAGIANKSIKFNATTLNLKKGQTSTLKVTWNPAKTSKKTLTWTSSNAKVASVKSGVVTAVAAGKATITATNTYGKKATCTVNVSNPLTPTNLPATATPVVTATATPVVTATPAVTTATPVVKTPGPTGTPRPTPVPMPETQYVKVDLTKFKGLSESDVITATADGVTGTDIDGLCVPFTDVFGATYEILQEGTKVHAYVEYEYVGEDGFRAMLMTGTTGAAEEYPNAFTGGTPIEDNKYAWSGTLTTGGEAVTANQFAFKAHVGGVKFSGLTVKGLWLKVNGVAVVGKPSDPTASPEGPTASPEGPTATPENLIAGISQDKISTWYSDHAGSNELSIVDDVEKGIAMKVTREGTGKNGYAGPTQEINSSIKEGDKLLISVDVKYEGTSGNKSFAIFFDDTTGYPGTPESGPSKIVTQTTSVGSWKTVTTEIVATKDYTNPKLLFVDGGWEPNGKNFYLANAYVWKIEEAPSGPDYEEVVGVQDGNNTVFKAGKAGNYKVEFTTAALASELELAATDLEGLLNAISTFNINGEYRKTIGDITLTYDGTADPKTIEVEGLGAFDDEYEVTVSDTGIISIVKEKDGKPYVLKIDKDTKITTLEVDGKDVIVFSKNLFNYILTVDTEYLNAHGVKIWSDTVAEDDGEDPTPTNENWALASKGGTATASEGEGNNYTPMIDGSRVHSAGGRWRTNILPATVTYTFAKTVNVKEINLFSQLTDADAGANVTPTLSTITNLGFNEFEMEYYDGTDWILVPNGEVTGNNKVWNQILLDTPISTNSIRVTTTGDGSWARFIEFEAWGYVDEVVAPTASPTASPTVVPTASPTVAPTASPAVAQDIVVDLSNTENFASVGNGTTATWDSSVEALRVVTNGYGQGFVFKAVIPEGYTLDDYESLEYDLMFNSDTGNVSYKKITANFATSLNNASTGNSLGEGRQYNAQQSNTWLNGEKISFNNASTNYSEKTGEVFIAVGLNAGGATDVGRDTYIRNIKLKAIDKSNRIDLSLANVASFSNIKEEASSNDSKGALTFTSTGVDNGGGYAFYFKNDKTPLDLTAYKRIDIEFGNCDNGAGAGVDVVCEIYTQDPKDFGANVEGTKYITVKNNTFDGLPVTQTVAYGIKVKVNDWQKPVNVEKTIVIKSITLVPKDA